MTRLEDGTFYCHSLVCVVVHVVLCVWSVCLVSAALCGRLPHLSLSSDLVLEGSGDGVDIECDGGSGGSHGDESGGLICSRTEQVNDDPGRA